MLLNNNMIIVLITTSSILIPINSEVTYVCHYPFAHSAFIRVPSLIVNRLVVIPNF
jgi:hypothetical protein